MPDQPAHPSKPESLDEIVSHSAVTIAEQIRAAAAWAKSEMDLQIEVAAKLKDFARRAQIKLEGHHNVTIAMGRPDSVYGSVIVEYKDPKYLSPNKDAAPNKALIEQLKRRFYDMRREENRDWKTMFGVGTDGSYFIFLRFRDDKWTDQEPLPVDRYSTERFLWALYNLGQKGKPYQPEYLHGDFGSESPAGLAPEGVLTLYEEILSTTNPRAGVFFDQWKILFGEVCGYDVENLSDKLKKLAEFYGVTGKTQPAQLLFAVHTYYAILIKLLAAEIVSFFNPWMPRQVEKLQSATTQTKLRRDLQELERGGIFHQMGITNFLEGDLFSWYLDVWSDSIQALVRKMVTKLDDYNPGTFSEDPVQSRDLLKKLYQQLFPKSVRHDLGEYYTPDWLAEHVLNELGYEGDPDKRLLDPACGSGTFLVIAINRIRHWYDLNREHCAYDEGELLRRILANVVGFDLNPLAVMAARTNYLVAIKGLIHHVDHVEIPVYLCDSIMTPAEYGDVFGGTHGTVAEVPCSAMKPPYLLVPKEIVSNPREVAKYAEALEDCVKKGLSSEEFLARCRDEGLSITATESHTDLYQELVRLEHDPRGSRNGIWARIIKNNFAPLFEGKESFDYVVGNPPWINWEGLPAAYRSGSERAWHQYALTGSIPLKKRQASGKSKTDISILMTYVSCDAYLKPGGSLGFVITRTVFQSEIGGWHFRRFSLPDGTRLGVVRVDDFDRLKPFRGRAANATASFIMRKAVETKYPVQYVRWEPTARGIGDEDDTLADVQSGARKLAWVAYPVRKEWPQSSWLVGPAACIDILRDFIGASPYAPFAREGVNTRGANGVYFVDVLKADTFFIVRNRAHDGDEDERVPTVERRVELDYVFPLLRGRDVGKWSASPAGAIVLPHDPDHPTEPIPFRSLGKGVQGYLGEFKGKLQSRKKFRNFDPSKADWHGLYSVLEATFAPYKVVWKEMASGSVASVVEPYRMAVGMMPKVVIPDHKLMIIPATTIEEAYFITAILNSTVARYLVLSFAISTGISTHILDKLPIPQFDQRVALHSQVSQLAMQCHTLTKSGDKDGVRMAEALIDKAVAKLWHINSDQLITIQNTVQHVGGEAEEEEVSATNGNLA